MNTERLQQIKDEVAKSRGWKEGWIECDLQEEKQLWPIICEEYARECVKASLEKAAENASKLFDFDKYPDQLPELKPSITDSSNIVLL